MDMKNKDRYWGYKVNPYNPFPLSLRTKLYCEVSAYDDNSRGLIWMEARKFKDVIQEDREAPDAWCLSPEEMNGFVEDGSYWVYRLEYFEINNHDVTDESFHSLDWCIADYARNLEEYFFLDFCDLIDFIFEKWSVGLNNFKYDYDITLPLG